jgi:superfamily II DNA/RNA helicase
VCRWLADLAGHDGIVRALEPSVGIGRMILANGPPRCLVTDPRYKETRWTAVELSDVSAKMFAAMRPDVELYAMSLERWMSEHAARYQGTLGYVVANPPYGGRGEYARQDKHPDYQERAAYAYFMRRCLDLLVPRGLGVFVIPAGFLTGSTNRKLRERVLLRHHLEVAFRLPSESTTGKDLFPGAHNVVDVLFWRARGGELRQVDPGDGFILEGDYFKEHPAHILGTEVEEEAGKKRRRYAVVGDFTGFPAFTPRPVCESCAITNLPTFEVTPVTTVTRDMDEAPDNASDDLRQALDLGRRVDRYLALVAAEDPRATGLWPELSEALRNLKHVPALRPHDGNPWRWPELRALAERRALAQRLLAAYQKTGELAPALAQAPNIQPKFRAQPGDVLAQAEHLHRSRRHLTIDELEAFHETQGGLLDRALMVRQLLEAEWNLDGDDWNELVPARAYLGGMLWPKYDRAAARAPTDPQADVQMRRLEGAMNLAVFEDIRDISPRQGWVPPALVSAWLSDTLNRRYGAITLARAGGTIQPEGSDYAKLGTTAALTPETLWCLGWMNHDFTLFKPDLSDAEIQKLIEEDEAATGKTAAPADDEEADDETDEDEDLGQIRLLLGRHWDRQFTAWVGAQEDRQAAVRDAYNRSFRGIVIATYDGGTLDIARWNEGGPQLKPHQIAGILRVLDMRGGLIAFDVGVGKTYTAIGVVAAGRQEGWVHRPVVLVPSSLVWKWHDDFLCVLPDYRVLVIGSNRKRITRGKRKGLLTSETDTPEERAAKWSAFQAGLYDVVILSYDALARTKMNQEALLEYVKTVESLQRQVKLRQRNAAKKKAEDLSERDRAILKHGVRAFVEEMLELPDGHKFDPGIAWDDIGIDMLIVDEAAAFKNSYKPEAREHGLPKFMGSGGDGSKRAWQLDFRAAAVRQRTGGSGIVLLTATPAKNSPLEFYNLIQLIDPYAFSSRGLMDPEQFIDRFLRIESREIIDMTLKVSMRSVVDGFKNLDDLGTIVHRFCEFRDAADANLTVPEPRIEQVRVPLGPEQEDKYGELVRKLERTLQQSQIKGSSQNTILGLLARLSLVALHANLDGGMEYGQALSSVAPVDYASPKLTACAERVAASAGCGHIIFCEPTAVHLWMREVLVAHKVPRERIAILNAIETQSADRLRIAREFNGITAEPPAPGACASGRSQRVPPKYDVIIANSVAYEGIDLQVRTCAIHHLDLPWTPADLEQRNGRAVRQGNELPVVQIYYYLSDRSMDWYRYTLIQGKRGWLRDLLASQARDTSNPGAQQALSDEEILLMISRDPEATQRALDARREALRAEARHKVAREAANLLIQADARYRDARETTDTERAARLRAEGDERLKDLKRIDVAAWPWARLAERAREVEMIVASAASAPVFEGLRVGRGKPGAVRYHEFGRVLRMDGERRIGRRAHGFPVWELLGDEALRALDLQPSDVEAGAGWPDEDEAELQNLLESHIDGVLRERTATYEDLGWLGASDAWLTRWWPRVEKQVREGLVPSTAEQVYPLMVDGALTLASGLKLRGGELLAPTLAGWQRFLEVTPASGLKFGELREAGAAFWARKFPRGLLGTQGGAETEDATETKGAAEASSTSLDPQQAEALQGLLDRHNKRADEGTPAEVDRRVLDNLLLQRAATADALSMGGGGKAEFDQVGHRFTQTAERLTIVRAVAAVLRGRGYQAVMGEGDAQMLNILGKGGRLLGAATQSGTFRHAPGLAGDALAQVARDVADAHRIVKAIIFDEAQKRGPKVSEELMLAVWQRARAHGQTPDATPQATPASGSLDPEEARMGELLRRGRDDEEARWAAAVERGIAVERAQGLAPEAARKAAIQNLAADIRHYAAAATASPSPARAAAPTTSPASAYQDARNALKALALPPKKYAYFVRRADDAIEAGKGWSPIVARARRAAEKLGGPAKPAQKPPARMPKGQAPARPPAVDTAIDRFNDEAGWRVEKLRPRANGYVLAVYPEGKDADAAVASVDVIHGDVDEVRWIDDRLTQNDRDGITERLNRALWDAYGEAEDDDDDAEPPPSPLQDLIDLMDRRSTALGARPAHTANVARKDGYRPIAEALRDLAKPSGPSADELQRWLESEDLMSAGEAVGRARGHEPVTPRQLMQELWSGVFEVLTLEEVSGRPGALVVPDEALFTEDNSDFVLQRVRQGEHFIVRRVRVRAQARDEETGVTTIEDPTDRLAPEATVHRAERPASFYVELYGKLGAFQDDLERAPRTLQDVRTLLYWSAVMLDAPLCQGEVKARAATAFTQAKAYHDTARRQLLEGRSVDAVRRLHEAMRRISSAAAELARSCAEGQIDLGTTAQLPVRPEDQATIEGRD